MAESARWGDQHREVPYTRDAEWQSQRDSLLTDYFPNRSAIVLDQFRDAGLLPRLGAPKTNHPGGEVAEGFRLSLDASAGLIYYTLDGTDPRQTGGSIAPGASVFGGTSIRLDTSVTLKARTLLDGKWSALHETDFLIDRTNVVGGWTGRLSNSGETIELVNPEGGRVDRVRYADEGDWAVRQRGPLDSGHRGWVWSASHDGGGSSVELINWAISNNSGQNWASSASQGGTPGAPNSTSQTNIAPLITEVAHFPAVPRSDEPVTVTAEILDERTDGMTAVVAYRRDGAATFTTLSMADDGLHGDADANDGVYGAELPAAPDGTVVECFVRATDSAGNTRSWPAPTQDAGQATNLLYQVDDTADLIEAMRPGAEPIYFLVMTDAERAELSDIGDGGNNEERTSARMNGTFISVDESGTRVRYNVGIRNRGHGSRFGPPNNYRVNFATIGLIGA